MELIGKLFVTALIIGTVGALVGAVSAAVQPQPSGESMWLLNEAIRSMRK